MITRRAFLAAVAAAPIARAAGRKRRRVAVIGAGAFGGWTALELRRRGADVVLIDAWGPGNTRSSSGGDTRVIRAVYGEDRIYVEMVRKSFAMWEALARPDLYVQTGVLWLHRGDDDYIRSSVPLMKEFGFPLARLELADARRRYPQVDFAGVRSAWFETRAGALSARQACATVCERFVERGGTYRTARGVPGAIEQGSMKSLKLSDGAEIAADAYVFACGPWLGQLFPDVLGEAIQATRQDVLYFGTPAGNDRYTPRRLPIWIDFGQRIFYGLPDIHDRGFKICDDTRGETIDPTTLDRTVSTDAVARARAFLAERFPELAAAPLIGSEVCQYENSPDGHLVLDRHPAAENVFLVGGGSGHGFKLGPAVGSIVAAAILEGAPTPETFRIGRFSKEKGRKTQFERG